MRMRALITLLILAPLAVAHGLGVEARRHGAVVFIEGFFDDDTPAIGAVVKVRDGDRVIAEGVTDPRGAWSFPVPAPGSYRVTLDAGSGHLATATLRITEVEAATDTTRAEYTRTPWLGILTGLAMIAAAAWGARRIKARGSNRP